MYKPHFTGDKPEYKGNLRTVKRIEKILKLRNFGKKVTELTPYQFRINGIIDLYPVHGRFHNIKTGKRGFYPAD